MINEEALNYTSGDKVKFSDEAWRCLNFSGVATLLSNLK